MTKNQKVNFKRDILKLVECKMSSRKLVKLNGTPESRPTAWGLKKKLATKSSLMYMLLIL